MDISYTGPKHSAGILKGVSHKGSWPHNFIIRDVKHDFTSNGKREFVPRDQVSSLLVVNAHHFYS